MELLLIFDLNSTTTDRSTVGFRARERARIHLSDKHSFIVVRLILEKCRDIGLGPFSGFYGAFWGIFSTESWTKHRDWFRMRRLGFLGVPHVVFLRLQHAWGGCLHLLALSVKNWYLAIFPFRLWIRFRITSFSVEHAWSFTVGLGPRTLFILQELATDSTRRGEPQGIMRSWAIAIVGDVNTAKSRSFFRSFSWSDKRRQGETLKHWQEEYRLLKSLQIVKN